MSMRMFAFRSRLFFVYTAVIIVVVALFSTVLLVTTVNASRNTELFHQQEIYQKNLLEVGNILRQMDRLAAQVVSNNEILGCFIPLATDGDPSNYFETNLIDSIRVSSLLSGINGADRYAARISVFNGLGDYVSAGSLYETPEVIARMLAQGYYGAVKGKLARQDGSGFALELHPDRWSDSPGRLLVSLYRALSSFTHTVYGLVDIQVDAELFGEYAYWAEDGGYLLADREGAVVYPEVSPAGLAGPLGELIRAVEAGGGDAATLHGALDGRSVVLMGARVYPSDWLFVRVLPQSALLSPYASAIAVTAAACLVLLACLVLVMYYLALRLAGPLQSLSNAVASVSLQNMGPSIEATSASYATAELDALSQSFRAMLQRLDQSIAMEIQAHIRALQSQMNPHFLFNMLSVIIEACDEKDIGAAASMCLKLSSMLRYTADFGGGRATLAEEVRHTRDYLDLMQSRYEDTFRYDIKVEGPIEQALVPKIIMQPLAENCFTHGFRDCRPPWCVRVEAAAGDGRWSLKVTDNGAGVSEETIAAIYEQVERYRLDVGTNYENLRLGGVGLVNTLLRLSLVQSEGIHFSIENNPGGGATVRIGGRLQ